MTDRIEAQVERFAPGFRDRILGRVDTYGPAAMEAHNANYIGGDINGGIQDIRQLIFRPWPSLDPYRAATGLYLCSSSTPPGGGVHGMCGAARGSLRPAPRAALTGRAGRRPLELAPQPDPEDQRSDGGHRRPDHDHQEQQRHDHQVHVGEGVLDDAAPQSLGERACCRRAAPARPRSRPGRRVGHQASEMR